MSKFNLERLGWGECYCPKCHAVLKANQNAVRFFCRYKHDAALFMLCPVCAASYELSTPDERSHLRDECLHNIESCSANRSLFACTTLMALSINHGDYCAAVENGTCGLDRQSYELIASTYEAVIFVNGFPVQWQGLLEDTLPTSNWPINGHDHHQQKG